jgi:SAM-dependent methyltransferase
MPITERVAAQVAHEVAFWQSDPHERPGVDSLENFLNKAQDAAIFYDLLRGITLPAAGDRVAELGGGQGWASCLLKRLVPAAHVVLTDVAAEAVAGRVIWERVFNCTLDDAVAAPAQDLPFASGSVDFLFCYAAAHHFVDFSAALAEIRRVLSDRGRCVWFYEPTAPRWIHAAAERRVNRKRPDVPEHVLIPADVVALAHRAGLTCAVEFCTSIAHRGRGATLYYTALGAVPMLQQLLPCTAHFTLTPAGGR